MKIYSWNMYWFNRTPQKAFNYIAKLDFDILCLQEVPESFLERLKELPYHMAHAVDIVRVFSKSNKKVIYTVILSRYPVISSAPIVFPQDDVPLRTRVFVRSMRPFGWSKNSYRGSLYADIALPTAKVRVFSLHLTLSGPTNRRKELEIVESNLPDGYQAILCGDFNVIERGWFKMLHWFLGSPIAEALPGHDERSVLESAFESLGFQNPLRGLVTHPFSRSQLDHILVPATARISRATVSKKGYGSDHKPVFVELKS